jgi:hypothetical protein
VAGLGAVLMAGAVGHFEQLAPALSLPDASAAREAARQFAAGDRAGALGRMPGLSPVFATDALVQAFRAGFSRAALAAAGVSAVCLLMTMALLPRRAAALPVSVEVAPGE